MSVSSPTGCGRPPKSRSSRRRSAALRTAEPAAQLRDYNTGKFDRKMRPRRCRSSSDPSAFPITPRSAGCDGKDMHARVTAQLVLAQRLPRELVSKQEHRAFRSHDATGRRHLLQSAGDVDRVAPQVERQSLAPDDTTDGGARVHPDAQLEWLPENLVACRLVQQCEAQSNHGGRLI